MKRLDNNTYISGTGNMVADILGASIDMSYLEVLTIIATVANASTLTGNLILQFSADGTIWVNSPDAAHTQAVTGNANFLFENLVRHQFARFFWDRTGGDGDLSVAIHGVYG